MGVKPSTMTKFAFSSPVFDPFTFSKSTVIASRCFASSEFEAEGPTRGASFGATGVGLAEVSRR